MPNFLGTLHWIVASSIVAASPAPAPVETAAPQAAASFGGYVYYDSQYDDTISNFAARHDFAGAPIVPYAAFTIDYDTRSTAAEPEIYNDNAAIANAGVSAFVDKGGYASVFAAAGYSFGLRGQRSYPETRYGFTYDRSYGSSWKSDFPHAVLSSYLTAYSRYAGNVLEESGASIDARLSPRLRAVAGTNLAFDTHREYGNNYAELFAGILWPIAPNVGFQTIGCYGRYLSRGVDAPANPDYTTIRVELNVKDL